MAVVCFALMHARALTVLLLLNERMNGCLNADIEYETVLPVSCVFNSIDSIRFYRWQVFVSIFSGFCSKMNTSLIRRQTDFFLHLPNCEQSYKW